MRVLRVSKNVGFTLIEVMVVFTIISILAAIGIANYRTSLQRARDGRRVSDLEQMRTALEIYRSDTGLYPETLDDLSPNYITTLPTDPLSPRYDYFYLPDTGNYRTYSLCAHQERGDESDNCGVVLNCGDVCNYVVANP